MNFGEQIKKIRKEQSLTQQEMADKLNVSRQAVSNWENDKNLPDIEMLITMAQVFHLTLDELILGGTQMNNMTEKLIRDGSANARTKMNLIGIKIGAALLALGFVTVVAGTFSPASVEAYWSFACTALMLGGVLTFLVLGVKNIASLFKGPKGGRLSAIGGILTVAGFLLFGVSLAVEGLSGLIGLTGITVGILITIISAITEKE